MSRLATHLIKFLLLLTLILFTIWQPVWAQQNLLVNPGFESPFSSYTDAVPTRQVAQGWIPWYVGGGQSASENVYPEYYPASNVSDGLGVPRIRSGNDAQQYHSFFATHDAGVYQRVTGVSQGTELTFTAYVYVWSTSFDDVNESEGDGGVVVQVGIDPTGGTSGESANIVWSTPSIAYDAYNQYSVRATAQATAVTVFVRTTVSTPVKNTNIYIDDASLVAGNAGQPPTASPTTQPPTATTTLTPTLTATSTNTTLPPTNTPGTSITDQPTSSPVVPTSTFASTDTLTPLPTQTVSPTPPPTDTPVVASPTPTQETPEDSEFPGRVIHSVQAGDTVGQLATLYGSSAEAIIAANGLSQSALIRIGQALIIPVRLSAPSTSTPTATSVVAATSPPLTSVPPTTVVYTVQLGDTLNRIALRFNTTVAAIAQLNGIANVNLIRTGQQLIIPTGSVVVPSPPPAQQTTYTVQPGDTLFRIALRFGIPLTRLIQVNAIADPNRVYVGQILVIT